MNLNALKQRLKRYDRKRLDLFSRLMVNTTLNFFIALVVFVVACWLLLPNLIHHQDNEIRRLQDEVDALNKALEAVRADATRGQKSSDKPSDTGTACSSGSGTKEASPETAQP